MSKKICPALFPITLLTLLISAAFCSDKGSMPHLTLHKNSKKLFVDGQPFLMLAGELHNSSSSSLDYMQPVWDKLKSMNLNTVIAPVSWELVEPKEDEFDFTVVDGLIRNARKHNLKLVLLWFGSWKNTESSYVPSWVKRDQQRFPRVRTTDGMPREILTAFSKTNRNADAKAFSRFMRHLKNVDKQRTVIMVQIQNETGLLGEPRDHHPLAEKAFKNNVPDSLISYLKKNSTTLHPAVRRAWITNGRRTDGTWSETFGDDAAEFFMAWHIARYIDVIAEAGKKEYELPLFVNTWLRAHGQKAGEYPSGGPVAKVHDVWRAAAPHLDLFAPDIYLPYFKEKCAEYARQKNPLFIPEAHRNKKSPGQAFYAFAEHDAIGYAPFGIDDIHHPEVLAPAYGFLQKIMPVITQYQGTGQMKGLLEEDENNEEFVLGNTEIHVKYDIYPKHSEPSFGFIINTGPDEYLIAGSGFEVTFHSLRESDGITRILQVDEVFYENETWQSRRRLNGDETAAHQRIKIPSVITTPAFRDPLSESTTHPPIPLPPKDFVVQRMKVYRVKQ